MVLRRAPVVGSQETRRTVVLGACRSVSIQLLGTRTGSPPRGLGTSISSGCSGPRVEWTEPARTQGTAATRGTAGTPRTAATPRSAATSGTAARPGTAGTTGTAATPGTAASGTAGTTGPSATAATAGTVRVRTVVMVALPVT